MLEQILSQSLQTLAASGGFVWFKLATPVDVTLLKLFISTFSVN